MKALLIIGTAVFIVTLIFGLIHADDAFEDDEKEYSGLLEDDDDE